MRHEVMIPFEFNTDAVEAALAKMGEEQVTDMVRSIVGDAVDSAIAKEVPARDVRYYGATSGPDWGKYIRDKMYKWMDDHSEEIIDEAALLMAARASRRKAWRDVLAEVKGETDG